jgi:hypothetical protein
MDVSSRFFAQCRLGTDAPDISQQQSSDEGIVMAIAITFGSVAPAGGSLIRNNP